MFTTQLILSRLDLFIQTESNKELSLVLPPLGALTTLQFSLTAAPASQPRNALFAQVFCVTIAILLCYIPKLDPWLRSALTPAIVIPCMARLGITHPPAGAAAAADGAHRRRHRFREVELSKGADLVGTARKTRLPVEICGTVQLETAAVGEIHGDRQLDRAPDGHICSSGRLEGPSRRDVCAAEDPERAPTRYVVGS